MKKILGLTVAALIVITLVGGSTWAYFTDTESSTGNSLVAGTLDLNIDGGNTAVTTFSVSNVAPGDSGSGNSTLANVGSLDGELDVAIGAITNTGGSGGTQYEDGSGDLGSVAEMALYIDVNQNGTWNNGDICLRSDGSTYNSLEYDDIDSFGNTTWDAVETLAISAQDDIVVAWRVPTTAGNSIQGDSISFGITFTLEQADED